MCVNRLIVSLTVAIFAALAVVQAAHAALLIQVDKSAQRMTVTVDGKQLYDWPVSTGGGGYDTPSGSFKPFRMEIDHTSDEWDDAPMPYSIFFTKIGHAIHGTNQQRNLGQLLSARLRSTVHAKRGHAMGTGEATEDGQHHRGAKWRDPGRRVTRGGALPAVAANADEPLAAAPMPQYQPRYDDRPLLPFPFFFGR